MAPHSSTLAWKIPWTEEPGRLQSMGSLESDTTEQLHFHFSLSCIGEGNGSPLQCSCLENPRDGGAWWASVYGVTQSRTRLKQLSSSMNTFEYFNNQYASCRSLHPRLVKRFLSRPGLFGIQKSWLLLLDVCFLASMLNVIICSYVLGVHLNCYLIKTQSFVLSNLQTYDIRYNRGLLTTSGTQNYFESLLALNSSYCLLVTISK